MSEKYYWPVIVIFVIASVFLLSQGGVILRGEGATFPYPLYREWIKIYRAQTGVRITYLSAGSGRGIKALFNRKVDFGATDAFISDEELASVDSEVLHIPTALGAVVVTYNLPGVPELKLTGSLAAEIFSGKIAMWSDNRIKKVNPSAALPEKKISVVHRSDGSGTTFVFTNYLSVVNPEWKETVGKGKSVRWPVGIGVDGNLGVRDFIKKIPGSIGYVQLNYARSAGLPVAVVQNKEGRFIKPSLEAVSTAARGELPADTRALIIDTGVRWGYPISAFTWLIVYKEQAYDGRTRKRAKSLAKYLWWAIHEGQHYNHGLYYAKLPDEAVRKAEAIIRSMTFNGKPVVDW